MTATCIYAVAALDELRQMLFRSSGGGMEVIDQEEDVHDAQSLSADT